MTSCWLGKVVLILCKKGMKWLCLCFFLKPNTFLTSSFNMQPLAEKKILDETTRHTSHIYICFPRKRQIIISRRNRSFRIIDWPCLPCVNIDINLRQPNLLREISSNHWLRVIKTFSIFIWILWTKKYVMNYINFSNQFSKFLDTVCSVLLMWFH